MSECNGFSFFDITTEKTKPKVKREEKQGGMKRTEEGKSLTRAGTTASKLVRNAHARAPCYAFHSLQLALPPSYRSQRRFPT